MSGLEHYRAGRGDEGAPSTGGGRGRKSEASTRRRYKKEVMNQRVACLLLQAQAINELN